MSFRPITRRAIATGAVAAAGVAVMRNLIRAQETPEASPSAEAAPQLLVRVHTISSMQAGFAVIAVPEFSLFDDGSIYALGPQLAIFPPPALPNLTHTRIGPEATQSLVAAGRTAGLDQPRNIPAPALLADAPTTVVTFFDGEELITSSATGLMILDEPPSDWDEPTWEAFLALRAIVSKMIGWPTSIDSGEILQAERSIDPDRVQLMAYRSTNAFAKASDIPNVDQPVLVWPLATPLSEYAGTGDDSAGIPSDACHELSGQELEAVIDVVREGDLMSPWADAADDSVLYGVLMKPLLPDQSACEA